MTHIGIIVIRDNNITRGTPEDFRNTMYYYLVPRLDG